MGDAPDVSGVPSDELAPFETYISRAFTGLLHLLVQFADVVAAAHKVFGSSPLVSFLPAVPGMISEIWDDLGDEDDICLRELSCLMR